MHYKILPITSYVRSIGYGLGRKSDQTFQPIFKVLPITAPILEALKQRLEALAYLSFTTLTHTIPIQTLSMRYKKSPIFQKHHHIVTAFSPAKSFKDIHSPFYRIKCAFSKLTEKVTADLITFPLSFFNFLFFVLIFKKTYVILIQVSFLLKQH